MVVGGLIELFLFSLPSLVLVLARLRKGADHGETMAAVGFTLGRARDYGVALLIAIAFTAAALIVGRFFQVFPRAALNSKYYSSVAALATHGLALNVLLAFALTTLAEEILFRGFLAGLLIRRSGFRAGNVLQAVIFLAPHCLLLLISFTFAYFLPVVLVIGWVLGWIRYRSNSVVPGWLFIHFGPNLITALAGTSLFFG